MPTDPAPAVPVGVQPEPAEEHWWWVRHAHAHPECREGTYLHTDHSLAAVPVVHPEPGEETDACERCGQVPPAGRWSPCPAECPTCSGTGYDGVRGVFDPAPAACIVCGGSGIVLLPTEQPCAIHEHQGNCNIVTCPVVYPEPGDRLRKWRNVLHPHSNFVDGAMRQADREVAAAVAAVRADTAAKVAELMQFSRPFDAARYVSRASVIAVIRGER